MDKTSDEPRSPDLLKEICMKTNTLQPQWILVARIGWVLITLIFLTTFILGLPYRYRELATACDAPACPPLTLSSADAASIDSTLFSMQGYASFHIGIELITALLMSIMAGLIFWKYFDNLMGILTAYLLIYIGLAGFVQAGFVFAVQYPSVEWFYNLLFALFDPLILLVIFIFPTGQFLNKLSLSVFMFIIFLWLLDKILIQDGIDIMDDVGTILFLGAFAFGIWSQIYRYRNISTAVEKQQTKWVLVRRYLIAILYRRMGSFRRYLSPIDTTNPLSNEYDRDCHPFLPRLLVPHYDDDRHYALWHVGD